MNLSVFVLVRRNFNDHPLISRERFVINCAYHCKQRDLQAMGQALGIFSVVIYSLHIAQWFQLFFLQSLHEIENFQLTQVFTA